MPSVVTCSPLLGHHRHVTSKPSQPTRLSYIPLSPRSPPPAHHSTKSVGQWPSSTASKAARGVSLRRRCHAQALRAQATDSIGEEGVTASKVVVVTGGARGIGRAICLRLAIQKGYAVAVNYSANKEAADTVVSEIQAAGGVAEAFQADVSNEEDVKRLFQDVSDSLGRPNFLVNNAGVLGPNTAESFIGDLDIVSVFDNVFSVNVVGPLLCTQEFVRRFQADGGTDGAIVNISSGSAIIGKPLIYGMSKGAVNSMLAGLVSQLAPLGIRVNNVAPGMTRTDMITEDAIDRARPTIPMDRAGEPDEIASVVAFLLSEDASYTSGANVRVAGGRP